MKLSTRIRDAELTAGQRLRFRIELNAVAEADGHVREEEASLIRRLVPAEAHEAGQEAAPLDSLWRHADSVIIACIYVAVGDGEYGVEEARVIGALAHHLGMSAKRLGELEDRTFATLSQRAGR